MFPICVPPIQEVVLTSYHWECPAGYILQLDNRKCKGEDSYSQLAT